MLSDRQAALEVLVTRVSGILVANGYQTDAGARVYVNEQPILGPDDPDTSVAVLVLRDEVGHQGENVVVTLPISVQAIVRADAVNPAPWRTIEALVADIKKAVEQDHDLGGTLLRRGLERGATAPTAREAGSSFVSTEIEYRLRYAEGWGAP